MKTFNSIIVGAVTAFNGTTDTDKNGKRPVMIQCSAGVMPNRNVLSGTVAEELGVEIGKTYLLQIRQRGVDKQFGPDFQFIKLDELHGVDIAKAINEIGPAEILNVERPEGYEGSYVRRTNAVEGLTTKRIRDGEYIPAIQAGRSFMHETAPEVLAGSTVTGNQNQEIKDDELDDVLNNKKTKKSE